MNIYLQGLTMGLAYVAPIGLQNLFVHQAPALTQKRSRVYITASSSFCGMCPWALRASWARGR